MGNTHQSAYHIGLFFHRHRVFICKVTKVRDFRRQTFVFCQRKLVHGTWKLWEIVHVSTEMVCGQMRDSKHYFENE